MLSPSPDLFIDIHSHHTEREEGVFRVFNVFSTDFPDVPKDLAISIGLHPWHLSDEAIAEMPGIIREAIKMENLVAIGEAGLDKVILTPLEVQLGAFKIQFELSREYGKPLIIHCVRAFQELAGLRRSYKDSPAWIVHGFNANGKVAEECIRLGIYLSIGLRLLRNPKRAREVLNKVPVSMIFAETDDDPTGIAEIYSSIAEYYQMSPETLKESVYANYCRVFGG